MTGAPYDPSKPDRTGQARIEWIAHVVLLEFAGAPARDIQKPIVEREIDVGDERRHRLEAFQERRQVVGLGWLGGNLDHLSHFPIRAAIASFAVPDPDRRGKVLE